LGQRCLSLIALNSVATVNIVKFGPRSTQTNFGQGWLDWVRQLESTQLNMAKFSWQSTRLNTVKFRPSLTRPNTTKFGSWPTRPNFVQGQLFWVRMNFSYDRLGWIRPNFSCDWLNRNGQILSRDDSVEYGQIWA